MSKYKRYKLDNGVEIVTMVTREKECPIKGLQGELLDFTETKRRKW